MLIESNIGTSDRFKSVAGLRKKYISMPQTQQVVAAKTAEEVALLTAQQQLEQQLLDLLLQQLMTIHHHHGGGGGHRIPKGRHGHEIHATASQSGGRDVHFNHILKVTDHLPKEIRQPLAKIVDTVLQHAPEGVTKELLSTLIDTLQQLHTHVHGKHLNNAHKLLLNVAKGSTDNLIAVGKALQQIIKLPAEIHEPTINIVSAMAESQPNSVTAAVIKTVASTLTEIGQISKTALSTTTNVLTQLATESPKTLTTLFAKENMQITKDVLTGLAKQTLVPLDDALNIITTALQATPGDASTILSAVANALKSDNPAQIKTILNQIVTHTLPDLSNSIVLTEAAAIGSGALNETIDDAKDTKLDEVRTGTDVETISPETPQSHSPSAPLTFNADGPYQATGTREESNSSTDSLLNHFENTENSAWKQAAEFRKMLNERNNGG